MTSDKKPVVLIVDDNLSNLQLLAITTQEEGYEPVLVTSAVQALSFIDEEEPDIILLDVMMPEMDGFELCRKLKANLKTQDIPVVFLTAKTSTEDIITGFDAGAVDYITKPFNPVELKARLRTHIRLKQSLDRLEESNEKLRLTNEELQEANLTIINKNLLLEKMTVQLELASQTDPLTGLYNRRYMQKNIESEINRVLRYGKHFCLIMSDIDHFKRVNDTYGHDCGDFILKDISRKLKEMIRIEDTLSRWGGEEFLLLLPETDLDGGMRIAERFRGDIEASLFIYDGQSIKITMTFGVSFYVGGEGTDYAIRRADEALYEGKNSGRNKVVAAR